MKTVKRVSNCYHVLLLVFCLLVQFNVLIIAGLSSTENVDRRPGKLATESSNTIWVPDNYTTIQAAIYAAGAGDTIRVQNGTYHENLKVNQSVKLIGERLPTICGESVGMFGKPTVDIDTENVTICGFIIQHYPFKISERDSGICLSRGGNITGNIIHSNLEGIKSGSGCYYNVISNNVIEGNGLGLMSDGAWNNITNNIVRTNGNGIYSHAVGGILINNTITNNIFRGFQLSVWGSKLRNNTISGNGVNFIRWETLLAQLICDIDTSNTINGNPIYYWINQSYRTVPSDAGYVAIINCTNIKVEGLTLEHNGQGVLIAHSSNVTVKNCNLTSNRWGVRLLSSSNVSLYHNNIIDNFYHQVETNRANSWDDGYPYGGNYWSDYAYVDIKSGSGQNSTGADGIGDAPHVLDANNIDHYPLMGMFHIFNTFPGCYVNIVSNSTIEDFQYFKPNSTIKIHVSNMTATQTSGFCRICIPHVLMSEPYNVTVDGANPTHWNYTLYDNGTHRWIYFAYQHSVHEIVIVPEFPSFLILPLFMIATLLAVIVYKRKHQTRNKKRSLALLVLSMKPLECL